MAEITKLLNPKDVAANRNNGNKGRKPKGGSNAPVERSTQSVNQRLSWLDAQLTRHSKIIMQHDLSLRLERREKCMI